MTRKIGRATAADGTELELSERADGNYTIVDDSGDTIEEVGRERGRQGALEDLQQTAQFMDQGRRSQHTDRQQGGWGSEMGFGDDRGTSDGGLFGDMSDFGGFGGGGSERTERRESDDSDDSGGLFGGSLSGGFGFGGGGRARRERDQNSGRFTSTRRERVDFEMERDADGRFSGRASDDERDSGGLFGGLF